MRLRNNHKYRRWYIETYNFFCLCISSSYLFHSQTKNRFSMVQYVGSNNRKPRNPLACRLAKPINVSHKVLYTLSDT